MDERFKARFVARYEQYEFHAGIMKEDEKKPHFEAKTITTKTGKRKSMRSAFTSVDGMTARRKRGMLVGGEPTIKQIYQFACKRAGVDIVKRPFQSPNTKAMHYGGQA